MAELKVWVDGLQRIVAGIKETTTCQDVIIALAHFKRQTGRYTLVEKSADHERVLQPHENPLRIMSRWSGTGIKKFVMKRKGDAKNEDDHSELGVQSNSKVCEKHRSMECLPRFHEVAVTRGNTFSGACNRLVSDKKETTSRQNKRASINMEELWELVKMQERILEEQYEDLEDVNIDIEELLSFEVEPTSITDLEDLIIKYERSLIKNDSHLEEEEFWEDELEIEESMKNELIEKLNKTKELIIQYEVDIQDNMKEIRHLRRILKEEKDMEVKRQQQMDNETRLCQREEQELKQELEAQEFEGAEYDQELEEITEELQLLEVELNTKIELELKLERDLTILEEIPPTETVETVDEKIDDEPAIPIKHQKSSSNPIEFLRGGVLRRLKGIPRELSASQEDPEGVFV